jgi:hypothetical protein
VTVTPGSPTIYAGTPVVLTIVVTYSGVSGFTDFQLSSTNLPSGLSLSSAKTTAGSCNSTPRLVCDLGGLAGGDQVTITVSAVAASAGQFPIALNGVQSGFGDHINTSYTLVAGAPLPIPVSPSSPPGPSLVTAPTLSIVAPGKLVLSSRQASLHLTARTSIAGKLTLALFASNGKKLAGFQREVSAGSTRLSLLLPKKARQHGRDALRIRLSGARKFVTVRIVIA